MSSDVVTIELDREGNAQVTHELLMNVRGGPLKSFDLPGVDAKAELLPDGTVTRARSGREAATVVPLLLEQREDATLRIEIDHKKGLRRGTYLFAFGYRTNFLERKLITAEGGRVLLRWVGPRLPDGLDSARVVFRLPRAPLAPRLPPIDTEQVGLGLEDDPGGTFLSNLRRSGATDELEVVRPHIAKGEPVLWRVQADARAFKAFAESAPAAEALDPGAERPAMMPRRRAALIGIGLGVALLYALLVVLKSWAVAKSSAARRARPRALVPLPNAARAALAGVLLSSAVAVALLTELPTFAAVLFVLALGMAAQRGPHVLVSRRGPGQWRILKDAVAFARTSRPIAGCWLDCGCWSGGLLLTVLMGSFAYGALRLLPSSPYHALMTALASASVLPIFCTGRGAELPADPLAYPRRPLHWITRRLRRLGCKAAGWARGPVGTDQLDELRVIVQPRSPLRGLIGMEIGCEYQHGGGGPVALPFVLVRVRDGSPSYRALPRDVTWVRGRQQEERVAVLRPKLPTWRMTLALVRRLSSLLTEVRPVAGAPDAGSGKILPRAA